MSAYANWNMILLGDHCSVFTDINLIFILIIALLFSREDASNIRIFDGIRHQFTIICMKNELIICNTKSKHVSPLDMFTLNVYNKLTINNANAC